MNINFQSDDLSWNNSASSYSSTFSFDNDDIPNLNDKNPTNYSSKNVEKVLSNQFHDLLIGEVSSAHLNTLQTTYVGFPKNTELESGLKHKSRNEIAIDSTKSITPQLEQFIFEYLNLSIEKAVGLSVKNHGADFVKSQNSDEEEEENKNINIPNINKLEEEEEYNEEEDYEKETVFDQEITLNEKNEDKKPTFFNSLKSLFNKPKENEINNDDSSNTSLNDSTSWWSKDNLKRSKSVGPTSPSEEKNDEENITESEEKSKKKKFFNSFPFFRSKTNDSFDNASENNSNNNSINNDENSKPQSPQKIHLKNIFAKTKENQPQPQNSQKTVKFASFDEENDQNQLKSNLNVQNDDQNAQNEGQILTEQENKQIVVTVENLEDFSSASDSNSDSESQKCHTPNSNPDLEDQENLFVVNDSEQETDEEMVKNLIRPPTPEKEVSIKFSSESEPFDKKQNQKEILLDSDSENKSKSNSNNNNNNSYHSNESKSAKDQDLLLSASESESNETSSSIHNKVSKNNVVVDKKTKSNLFNLHLSSSSSDPEIDNNNNNDENEEDKKSQKSINKKEENEKKLDELSSNSDAIKQSMSNVEFIANELSDFEMDHESIMNESQNIKQIKNTNQKLTKKEPLKISNQSSQTNSMHREILSRRNQNNIIQENTYFEVFEDTTNKKRIRKRKISSTTVDEEEEIEETNRKMKTKKRIFYNNFNSNSNSSSPNSPKGRSSNSSSPHSNTHNYSPVHTHTHTPVPVKPRLILRNNSSSDEYENENEKESKTKRSKINTPKSNKRRNSPTLSSSPSPQSKNTPPPAIRKRKTRIKSRNTENVSEFPNSASPKKKNKKVDEIEEEKDSLSPMNQTKRLVKRKKRASSEKRIKTRNPQLILTNNENDDDDDEDESKKTIKKKHIKRRRTPSLSTSQTQTQTQFNSTLPLQSKRKKSDSNSDYDDNQAENENENRKSTNKSKILPSSRLTRSSSELKNRTITTSSQSRRRLSADNTIIDKKTLAKNGVRSIILIEFDKKTPLFENLLEHISSNPGIAFSQSSPPRSKKTKRRSHSVAGRRTTKETTNDNEIDIFIDNESETMKSSKSTVVRPKITGRHGRNKTSNRMKLSDNENEFDDDSFDAVVNKNVDEFSTKSESRIRKIHKRRQNSVKPSALNKTVEPQKKNLNELPKKDLNLTRSVKNVSTNTASRNQKSEIETNFASQPLKKVNRSARRRMESVKSDSSLKRNVEQSEDYHNVRFNFKKLFDEAERKERLEEQK